MRFALKELTELLAQRPVLRGVVITVWDDAVLVATERGAQTARALAALAVGDVVLIRDGVASPMPEARLRFQV